MHTEVYPAQHREIVATLLSGKFIVEKSPLFAIVDRHRNFYIAFFKQSYDYELDTTNNYFFLTSKHTDEKGSRDFILFLALLAYEFHNERRDFIKELKENVFSVAEIESLIKNATKYEDLLKGTSVEEFNTFIKKWENRGVLSFVNEKRKKFRFNDPIDTFLQVADQLCDKHLKEENNVLVAEEIED
ncbi:MAG: hypothetical protein AAF900_01840 [Bacteroidota bacterium]